MREIQADIPIMIHLDNGGFNEMYVEWFDEFTKRAEPFAVSYTHLTLPTT